jgi:hypothetical protein
MKLIARSLLILMLSLFVAGCKTTTVQTRKAERSSAYTNLPPEFQSQVDQGRIKVGMPMDAVYIAWGKPSQILQGESSEGPLTTWLYHGITYEEFRYWNWRPYYSRYGYWSDPYLERDYVPRTYVRAEVVFQNGKVKSWSSLPRW